MWGKKLLLRKKEPFFRTVLASPVTKIVKTTGDKKREQQDKHEDTKIRCTDDGRWDDRGKDVTLAVKWTTSQLSQSVYIMSVTLLCSFIIGKKNTWRGQTKQGVNNSSKTQKPKNKQTKVTSCQSLYRINYCCISFGFVVDLAFLSNVSLILLFTQKNEWTKVWNKEDN